MRPKVKLHCKIKNLINAAGQYIGGTNIVVENGSDIDGAMNAILDAIDSHFISEADMDCSIDGDNAVISLKAKSNNHIIRNGIYTVNEAEALIRHCFFEEVKRLQTLIYSSL